MSFRRWVTVIGVAAVAVGGCSDDGAKVSTATTTASTSTSTTAVPTNSTTSPSLAPSSTTAPARVVDRVLRGSGERYSYEVTVPELAGFDDAAVQAAVNAEVVDGVTAAIDQFVTQAGEAPPPPSAAGDPTSGLRGTYELYLLSDRMVSYRLTLMPFIAGSAHPSTVLQAYTFDLASGRRLALADLFTAGAPYLQTLSEQSRQQLQARPDALAEFIVPGTEPTAENFDTWNLTGQALVITFDQYQVAPGVAGTPEVAIPLATLRTILDPNGPLAVRN